ncbi:heterodisulfide reductase-related iron-sulfur binding cluster [Desulfonatronospira sp.]|uniref:heterodisulfide reductase-related iron-sulfur binding cluster n=1 Tax=Desulfonatronospira sp. TaxID=1962951 RepID=UPI0025BB283A|nr:heterodisulfide reductase-related iron-sulfur binding cluster [Desulfonatronospira sp.]
MSDSPEDKAGYILERCADCDECRSMMTDVCPFFRELYRLFDEKQEKSPESKDLRRMVDLCNFCALCPCPEIRNGILDAKSSFIERDKMSPALKIIQNVEKWAGKMAGAPMLANLVLQGKVTSNLVKKAAGMHPDRDIPRIPRLDLDAWTRKQGITAASSGDSPGVALFAGCSARFFFPETGMAAAGVLQKNKVNVYYPEQNCCGMPVMLEGDRKLTLKMMEHNLENLTKILDAGHEIVCSCPTCGYMFRELLREKAYYSREYQEAAGADDAYILIPKDNRAPPMDQREHKGLLRMIYGSIFKDDGLFSVFPAMQRIRLAESVSDMGEYLLRLYKNGGLSADLAPVHKKAAYFPPCHLRKQGIGSPYMEILRLIPGLEIQEIKGSNLCCGMAGIMGFKQDFHHYSLEMGRPLMHKIQDMQPDILLCDCLSCRLQFRHSLSVSLAHPLEVLHESYRQFEDSPALNQ